jgi:small subunit ribosomal protein S8
MTNDNISDMLTRIRNGSMAKHNFVRVLYSKVNLAILKVLITEGYIKDFEIEIIPFQKTLRKQKANEKAKEEQIEEQEKLKNLKEKSIKELTQKEIKELEILEHKVSLREELEKLENKNDLEITKKTKSTQKNIKIYLKYKGWWIKKSFFSILKRISKPGKRVFSNYKNFNDSINVLRYQQGIAIISTSSGVMSHLKATQLKKGGEILCYIG